MTHPDEPRTYDLHTASLAISQALPYSSHRNSVKIFDHDGLNRTENLARHSIGRKATYTPNDGRVEPVTQPLWGCALYSQ